jgi:hypothetical protein
MQLRRMAEIGVYRGEFAEAMLRACDSLTKYYMIDPWRHLSGWNKPSNHDDLLFEQFFEEVKAKTEFAAARTVLLRGTTTEVIDQVPDGDLDLAYIDGDHTLRGIAVDLIRCYPKVRTGGLLGGDDFTTDMWQHTTSFEPTLVFPFAIHFAEAVGATIYVLPYSQFCIQKTSQQNFIFLDLTNGYQETALRNRFAPGALLKLAMRERFPQLMRLARKVRGLFSG